MAPSLAPSPTASMRPACFFNWPQGQRDETKRRGRGWGDSRSIASTWIMATSLAPSPTASMRPACFFIWRRYQRSSPREPPSAHRISYSDIMRTIPAFWLGDERQMTTAAQPAPRSASCWFETTTLHQHMKYKFFVGVRAKPTGLLVAGSNPQVFHQLLLSTISLAVCTAE